MSLPDIKKTLSRSAGKYWVLDIRCLFVAATLREEAWLYLGKDDETLLSHMAVEAEKFQIRDVAPDREIATYSGGEQAILACLLTLEVAERLKSNQFSLLLCGVMETLSPGNRKKITDRFQAGKSIRNLMVYRMQDGQVQLTGDQEQCAS